MRVVIAGVIAGIVVFFWGAVSHMLLPLGEVGLGAPRDEAALPALQASLPAEGVYLLPWLDAEQWGDEQATAAYSERARTSPYAFVVYNPIGRDPMAMGGMLGKQWVSDTLAGIVAAWIVSFAAVGFFHRALLVTAMGVFGWLAISVPYWNWYRFPLDFTLANLASQGIGWYLGGLAIAWWLGRARRPAA